MVKETSGVEVEKMREWTEKHIRELIDNQLKKLEGGSSGFLGLSFIYNYNFSMHSGIAINNLYKSDVKIPGRQGVIRDNVETFYATFNSNGLKSWDFISGEVRYKAENVFAYYPGDNTGMPRPVIGGKKHVSSGSWFVYQDGKYFPVSLSVTNMPTNQSVNWIVPIVTVNALYVDYTDEDWEFYGLAEEGWTHWKYYNFTNDNRIYFNATYKKEV